jgi:hypothetical protein
MIGKIAREETREKEKALLGGSMLLLLLALSCLVSIPVCAAAIKKNKAGR